VRRGDRVWWRHTSSVYDPVTHQAAPVERWAFGVVRRVGRRLVTLDTGPYLHEGSTAASSERTVPACTCFEPDRDDHPARLEYREAARRFARIARLRALVLTNAQLDAVEAALGLPEVRP
jgi:hypothetical protein